jgi:hypothetical protein
MLRPMSMKRRRVLSCAGLLLALPACGEVPARSGTASSTGAAEQGCAAFTSEVDRQESSEVFDARTGDLQIYVGKARYVLNKTAAECQQNPVAMKRLSQNDAVQEANAASPTPSATAYPWSDCNALRPGDAFQDVEELHCNPDDALQVEYLDCMDGAHADEYVTYVHLTRAPALGDLEGMEGKTARWRAAEDRDPSHGRTPWAFANCQEHE